MSALENPEPAIEEQPAAEEPAASEAASDAPAEAEAAREGPEPPKGVLWIASYPKSGNTWTRHFLHNLLKLMEEEDEGAPQDINSMNEYTIWEVSAAPYEKLLGKPVTEVERSEIAALRPQVQAAIAERTEGLAMIKTHHALVMDRGTPTINFEITSGAIYIVRNPLDVAVSFANHLGASIDRAIEEMSIRNLETGVSEKSIYEIYGSWSQHVESWTRKPHRAIYVMRYEDMLEDPTAIFGGLTQHLLMRPTPQQLATAIERSSFEVMKQQEDEAGFREKPDSAERFFRAGKAGEWRHMLTPDQVRSIVSTHYEQMQRFGYLTRELAHLVPRPA